ncbi:MAG: hypothetical protein ACLSA6_14420 [Holdemania massiliensis]
MPASLQISRSFPYILRFQLETIRLIQWLSKILQIADQIYNEAVDQIPAELNANLPFTLADHLEFCIERMNKKIQLKMPLIYELESTIR